MEGPRVHRFSGGWAATGDGFATFANTREEAVQQYEQYASRRCHSPGCEERATTILSGVPLCAAHHDKVVGSSGYSEGAPRSEDGCGSSRMSRGSQ